MAGWQVVEEVAAEAHAEAQVAEVKSLGRTLEKALSLAGVAVEKSEWVSIKHAASPLLYSIIIIFVFLPVTLVHDAVLSDQIA